MIEAELADVGLFSAMGPYGDLGIHAVLDVRRVFSQAELEGAMAAAIAAFPVMGSRYVPGFWRDHWQPVDGPLSEAVHMVDEPGDVDARTASWARRPIDLTCERPMRIVSLRRERGSRVIVSLAHLAVDGAGMAAVGHVLAAHLYGIAPSAPVDARRTVGSALDGLGWAHLPVLARDVVTAMGAPLRTLSAARRERAFPRSPSSEASWRHLTIAPAEVERIKARCKPGGASVNDALLAAVARVAAGRSSRGPVSILYTMDLRRYAASPRLTAANTSSILSVLVRREDIGDLAATSAAVAATTRRQRRGLEGPAFMLTPLALGLGMPHAWARRVTRWLLPVLVDLPLSRGFVFTNVGRIDAGLSAFGADLEDLRVIGPSIAHLEAPAIVAYGYRGALHLELFAPPGLAVGALEELELELRDALELPRTARDASDPQPVSLPSA